MRSIAAGAAGIMGPFAAFGKGILGEGLASAGSFEQTTVEMETMIGSATETQDTLAKLTKFAVDTPFEMPQLLQTTQGLIQFGERGDQLMETVKMLGDASGGTASKFQLLGSVFNQIRGVGKLMTQDFRQLSTRGIISLQDIAKHYGKTTAEAEKMLSTGKISFEDFRSIMKGLTGEGGRFENMMKKQSATLEGLKSTLNDSVNIMKRTLATPLVPMLKQLYSAGIAFSGVLEGVVRNGGDFISFAFAGATAAAALGTAIYGTIFAANLLGITFKKALIGSGIGIAIIAIGAALGFLYAYLSQSESFLSIFSEGWVKVKKFFQEYIDAFWAFVAANEDTFAEIQSLFTEIMANIEEAFVSLFTMAGSGMLGMVPSVDTVIGALQWVVDKIRDILDWLTLMSTNWGLTWELMKTNTAIVLVTIADQAMMLWNTMIAGAVGAGLAIWSIMKDMGENVMVVLSGVGRAILGVFKGLQLAINAALDGKDMGAAFTDAFTAELAKIRDGGQDIPAMGANASKAFAKGFTDHMGADSPMKGVLDTLEEDKRRIKSEMMKERERKREERKKDKDEEKKDDKKDPTKAPPDQPSKAATDLLKTGRYSFQDVGNKIQDAMLKDDKNSDQKKLVDIGQQGLAKQDEQIKATKDNKPAGLVP